MKIVYVEDGIIKIVIPCIEDLTKVIARCVPDGVDYTVIEDNATPPDRTFRNAWELSGQRVVVNMPKARVIHMDRIRAARDAQLKQLDVDYIKADEGGNAMAKATIAAEKTRLRDIPQTFDLSLATTPETLAALWPADLMGPTT
jgi:hypothetical protein